jgi:hypothetical protein
MKLGKLAMDYLLVQLRTCILNIALIQQCAEPLLFAVPTLSQSKLLVLLHVEVQKPNSLRPPGSAGNIIIELHFYNLMIEDP